MGELLVKRGLIDQCELRAMLSLQAELRQAHGEAPEGLIAERFRLGRLLVESGVIDEATLEEALARSRRSGQRLGEALVDAGAISRESLARALARQRKLTALALAAFALWQAAPQSASAGERARVHVAATVLPRASIDTQALPQELVLTAEDIARGHVELEAPVELAVRANHAVRLSFGVNSASLAGVRVRASEGAWPVGSGQGVLVPHERPGLYAHPVRLRLRLELAPGAAPGTIAYPLSVSLTPA